MQILAKECLFLSAQVAHFGVLYGAEALGPCRQPVTGGIRLMVTPLRHGLDMIYPIRRIRHTFYVPHTVMRPCMSCSKGTAYITSLHFGEHCLIPQLSIHYRFLHNLIPNRRHLEMKVPVTAETNSHKAKNCVTLLDQPAYRPRRLRIVCVGAGFSGLMLAYEAKYNKDLQGFIDLTIYDKNHDVGGTWLVNRYPGVAVSLSQS